MTERSMTELPVSSALIVQGFGMVAQVSWLVGPKATPGSSPEML